MGIWGEASQPSPGNLSPERLCRLNSRKNNGARAKEVYATALEKLLLRLLPCICDLGSLGAVFLDGADSHESQATGWVLQSTLNGTMLKPKSMVCSLMTANLLQLGHPIT